jgi:hypothetical protein
MGKNRYRLRDASLIAAERAMIALLFGIAFF